MTQPRHGLRFAGKAQTRLALTLQVAMQHLHGAVAIQGQVTGTIHGRHAP